MDIIPLIISFLALLLGGINFYWIFLKDRKVFHLINIKKITNGMMPEFAVVNGGKKDLLMTNLSCSFGNVKKDGHSFTPAQTLEFKESDSYLIPSGKGLYCKVRFVEKFTNSFAKKGKPELVHNKQLYMYDMYVDISWVEMDGKSYERSIELIKYGFRENGEIGSRKPLVEQFNLYK